MNILETKTSSILFNYIALIVLMLGLGLFYGLPLSTWIRWVIFILSVALAAGIFFFIAPLGKSLHSYIRDSWREVHKVVWPARKETIQFTWIVFLFVVILGLFLWAIDSALTWLLYSVILNKGN